jgi:hypothetical protein
MSIALGLNSLTDIKFGTNQISSVYLGNNLVWSNFSYILDLYPSAHHAYSLRKLSSTYTGKCLRVRRTTSTPSVTTTTVDVSFNSSNTIGLDSAITYVSGTATTATNLGQFCASIVNGYTNPDGVNTNQDILVVTWYDQSGNNKNPTQGTAGNQPRLVELGNLELSGGKVAVRFTSANLQRLTLADASVPLNNVSSYALGNSLLATTNNAILSMGDTINTNLFWLPHGGSIAYRNVNIWTNGNVANQPRLYELICGSSVVNAYANGGLRTPTTVQAPMTGNNIIIRLGQYSTNILMNGYVTEVISFIGTSNRTQIESNINTYYNVW